MLEDDPRWYELGWRWLQRFAREALMPSPKFHPPSPEMTRLEEREWQWWHIPISVKRKIPRRDIPGCRISVAFLEGQYAGQEFTFRWQSDLPRGSSETTLIYGVPRKIPLVVRRDKSPTATLTDHDFLMKHEGDYVISGITGETAMLTSTHYHDRKENHNLEPGNHKLMLKIKSGGLYWESKSYEIRVPAVGASNSHFNVVGSE